MNLQEFELNTPNLAPQSKPEKKPALTLESVEAEVHSMIQLMSDFSEVLEKESELLRAAKFHAIEPLQSDKRKYVQEYKNKIDLLSQHKEEFKALDQTLAEKLVLARTEFVKILNRNLQVLSAAKDSSRRIVQRILDTARDAVETKTNYNAAGAMMRSNPQTATSVQFNQEL